MPEQSSILGACIREKGNRKPERIKKVVNNYMTSLGQSTLSASSVKKVKVTVSMKSSMREHFTVFSQTLAKLCNC